MTGHLIHIGFPKAASTLLQRWFAEHPQLAYAEWGIAGFGNVLAIAAAADRPQGDIRYLVTSWEGLSAPPSGTGAAYVDYSRSSRHRELQANVSKLLAALSPQAHILIVTRGFRSMLLSSYSQYVRSGGAEDLENLLGTEEEDPWQYDYVASLYRRAFGHDKVLMLPWELLRDDREAFAGAIQDWLGVDHHPLPRESFNLSLTPIELRWYPRITRAIGRLPLGARVRRRLLYRYAGGAMSNRWAPVIRLLQRVRPAPPVTAGLVPDAVLERFRGHAAGLAADPRYAPYARDYLLD